MKSKAEAVRLLDQFAGQSLPFLLNVLAEAGATGETLRGAAALEAYNIAQAMIMARERLLDELEGVTVFEDEEPATRGMGLS